MIDVYCEFSVLAYNTITTNFRYQQWSVQNERYESFGKLEPISDNELQFSNYDIASSEFGFIATEEFLGNKVKIRQVH